MESLSIVGIDIGSHSTILATVKTGGIETVRSDTGGISTPCIVAYGESERLIGDAASNQAKMNFKNTVLYSYRFMGLNTLAAE